LLSLRLRSPLSLLGLSQLRTLVPIVLATIALLLRCQGVRVMVRLR